MRELNGTNIEVGGEGGPERTLKGFSRGFSKGLSKDFRRSFKKIFKRIFKRIFKPKCILFFILVRKRKTSRIDVKKKSNSLHFGKENRKTAARMRATEATWRLPSSPIVEKKTMWFSYVSWKVYWFWSLCKTIHFSKVDWFTQGSPNPLFYRCKFLPCQKQTRFLALWFEGVAKSRKTLSILGPGKGIERGRCTQAWRALTCGGAVLHWLANERQEGFWLQCRASFFRFYTYFQFKIGIFLKNHPFSP